MRNIWFRDFPDFTGLIPFDKFQIAEEFLNHKTINEEENPIDLTFKPVYEMGSESTTSDRRTKTLVQGETESLTQKHKVCFAKKWLKRFCSSQERTFSFCVILMSYYTFCEEKNEARLEPLDFLNMVQEELEVDEDLESLEQAHKMTKFFSGLTGVASYLDDENCDKRSAMVEVFQKLKFKNQYRSKSQIGCYDDNESCDSGFESNNQEEEDPSVPDNEWNLQSLQDVQLTSPLSIEQVAVKSETDQVAPTVEVKEETSCMLPKANQCCKSPQLDNTEKTFITVPLGTSAPRDQQALSDPSHVVPVKREREPNESQCSPSEDNSATKKRKWTNIQEKVIENVTKLLDLKNYVSSPCYEDAKKLSQVMILMLKQHELQRFLSTFVHSVSCADEKHDNLCFMFKRTINHVSTQKHFCSVRFIYGHILRLHLDTCNDADCKFPNCDKLREQRTSRKSQK